MKRNIGIVLAAVLMVCTVSVWSAVAKEERGTVIATVASHIGMKLNGTVWLPRDANSQPIHPLIVNGSTYLPVRALADALDVDIRWDEATQTVIIGDEMNRPETHGHEHSEPASGETADSGAHSHTELPGAAPEPHQAAPAPDLTKLPLGDGKFTTAGPKKGYIYVGRAPNGGGGGASKTGEWINTAEGTYDITRKAVVDGAVNWRSELVIEIKGDRRVLTGNRLPDHPTGNYPIDKNDDAYAYDRNPNAIKEQLYQLTLPANPVAAAKASPLNFGAIGVMLTGSVIFNGLDAMGRDAVAHETQDACYGHPEKDGNYHYHNLSACADDTYSGGHSKLVGYALDGFGIYGVYGESGEILANDDLDEFHGHTHPIEWDGKMVNMYHYHATHEYPYTLGAYKGTPGTFRMNP